MHGIIKKHEINNTLRPVIFIKWAALNYEYDFMILWLWLDLSGLFDHKGCYAFTIFEPEAPACPGTFLERNVRERIFRQHFF